jgi:hypothetical protein
VREAGTRNTVFPLTISATVFFMTRQEQLTFFNLVLSHDLNDNLQASALQMITSSVINTIQAITTKPGEEWFAQKQQAAIRALEAASRQEISAAVSSEHANRNRKTAEKGAIARNNYALAIATIEQPLRDLIAAMEQLISSED